MIVLIIDPDNCLKQIDSMFRRSVSERSQKTLKCGANISDTLACSSCATLFLPHFDDQFNGFNSAYPPSYPSPD